MCKPISVTVSGVDSKGRDIALTVSGDSVADFSALYKSCNAMIEHIKPKPKASFQKGNKKPFVYLPDAPKCPIHDKQMEVHEWDKDGKVNYSWNCKTWGDNGYCKEHAKPYPTKEMYEKQQALNA